MSTYFTLEAATLSFWSPWNKACSPIVDRRPPARAVVDSDGEEAEEEEEAGHPEAHLVDGRVPHQGFTVLPRVQLLAHVAVERHLTDKTEQKQKKKPTTRPIRSWRCAQRQAQGPRRTRPNSFHSERHACEGAEREHRRQQRPLFLSVLPLFFPRSGQAVRGALQRTVSVPQQRAQMNKLTASMSASQRGFGEERGRGAKRSTSLRKSI